MILHVAALVLLDIPGLVDLSRCTRVHRCCEAARAGSRIPVTLSATAIKI